MNLDQLDAYLERREDEPLVSGLAELFEEGERLWDEFSKDFHFRDYVCADVQRVYQALTVLQDQAETFLEWGSGLGMITSAAGALGYAAYGVEIDPKMYRLSQELADKYETGAEFAFGSFVPDDYEATGEFESEMFRTILDARDGYDDLGMDLRDFDIIYAYPWPGELPFFLDVARQCGRPGTLFLAYDAREGVLVERL